MPHSHAELQALYSGCDRTSPLRQEGPADGAHRAGLLVTSRICHVVSEGSYDKAGV